MRAARLANGWTNETEVIVLAAGAGGLKNLVKAAVNFEPRSILDWFHISMRLRTIEQMAAKVAGALEKDAPGHGDICHPEAAEQTAPIMERSVASRDRPHEENLSGHGAGY
jgi:hypothetical protein